MDTLKTLVMLAVLGGVGYGVYTSLHRKPTTETASSPPSPLAPPKLEIPGTGPLAKPSSDTMPGLPKPADDKDRFSAQAIPLGPPTTPPADGKLGTPLSMRPGTTPPDSFKTPGAPDGLNVNSASGSGSPAATGGFNAGAAPRAPMLDANGALPFAEAWRMAQGMLDQNRLPDAHAFLSTYYDNPQLSEAESRQLRARLDELAGTVIYSTQHLLEPPYVVQNGDTLASISLRYDVPPELLAKINGIEKPMALRPGDQLKVVRGPFDATVNVQKHELTLFLNQRYAGRFQIGLGQLPLTEPQYTVREKINGPRYIAPGPDRREIAPGDPANPLGERLVVLGDMAAIHGTNDPHSIGHDDLKGCISLSPSDIEDVYDILSERSKVTVRR